MPKVDILWRDYLSSNAYSHHTDNTSTFKADCSVNLHRSENQVHKSTWLSLSRKTRGEGLGVHLGCNTNIYHEQGPELNSQHEKEISCGQSGNEKSKNESVLIIQARNDIGALAMGMEKRIRCFLEAEITELTVEGNKSDTLL